MSTLKELLVQRDALQAQITEMQSAERKNAINTIRILCSEHALTAKDIFPSKENKLRKPVAPKYKDPVTGATWSGRGIRPAWLVDKDLEAYKISA